MALLPRNVAFPGGEKEFGTQRPFVVAFTSPVRM